MKNQLLVLFLFTSFLLSAQNHFVSLQQKIQHHLDSIITAEKRPGATLAVVMPDGQLISLATGYNDKEEGMKMEAGSQMFTGSTGKTFFSAIVLQQIQKGLFSLDDKISKFFGEEEWFNRLPNANNITVRSLMNHTSGLPRYVFEESFLNEIKSNPMRTFTSLERLSYIFDKQPLHSVAEGWGYSDTNYILLGMISEKASGKSMYDLVEKQLIKPFLFRSTYPSTQRHLPGLTQGYIGENNFFGLPKKTVENGLYAMNPQFEWTGGGLVTNVEDMAYWMKWLHSGKILEPAIYQELISPVDFKSGQSAETGYGLGTFVWGSENGLFYGHAGIMPGHLTQVEYSKNYDFAIAFQVNTDEGLGRTHHAHVQYFAQLIIDYLGKIDAEAKAGILSNFEKQTDCWNAGDIDCYMTGYYHSDEIRTITKKGQTWGFDSIRQNYKAGYPPQKMGLLHFDEMTMTRLSDNHYYVVGRYNLVYPTSELVQGWFSVIMQKIDGKWWMVSDHSS